MNTKWPRWITSIIPLTSPLGLWPRVLQKSANTSQNCLFSLQLQESEGKPGHLSVTGQWRYVNHRSTPRPVTVDEGIEIGLI